MVGNGKSRDTSLPYRSKGEKKKLSVLVVSADIAVAVFAADLDALVFLAAADAAVVLVVGP